MTLRTDPTTHLADVDVTGATAGPDPTDEHARRRRRGMLRPVVAASLVAVAATAAVSTTATAASSPTVPSAAPDTRAAAADRLQADLTAVAAAGAIGVVGANRAATGPSWRGAAGVRSIDAATPARPSDTVRVGSVTKAMISTLAMQEVDRKRWTLSTTVGEVLPGLLPGHGKVTLEQLLSHRSGLPDFIAPLVGDPSTDPEGFFAALDRRYTDRQLVAAALGQTWLFTPGSAFSYSNTNYVVVGMMLAAVTHRSVGSLLQQRVFAPAGMTSATFPTTGPAFRGPHLTDYALFSRPYNLDDTSSTLFSSAGAVVASASDISSFYRALFAGRLVSPASVRAMVSPRTTTPLVYGLGIYAVGDPCPAADGSPQALYGHDGATFGTSTVVFTSADGTRQASIAWGGRQFIANPPTSRAANDFLVDAFTASCPRPVPAGAPGVRAQAADPLPRLDTLTPVDRHR